MPQVTDTSAMSFPVPPVPYLDASYSHTGPNPALSPLPLSPAPLHHEQAQGQGRARPQFPVTRQHNREHFPREPLHVMNGINGNVPAGMMGFNSGPIPAGHQAELNYIYGMVEELGRQLADNRRVTEDIVTGLGRVRQRARAQGQSNEDIVSDAIEDIVSQEPNLDALISLLSESLEKAKYSRDANAGLLTHYATILAQMLKQFHEYKAKHVADVATWHRSYRAQLAEARAENSRLREQVWEVQERAGRANALLREFRRRYDEEEGRWEARVADKAARQELRFWKRMAMPDLAADDAYWSDDDDVVDGAEKERLRELERKAREQMAAGSQEGADELDVRSQDGQSPPPQLAGGVLGGIPMQREDSVDMGVPVQPPRPSSQASSTGSSGQ